MTRRASASPSTYMGVGKRAEARSLMESVAKGTGEAASMATVRLAAVAVTEGHEADADKLIDESLQKNPKNYFAMAAKAEMFLREAKLDEALVSAKSAVAAAESPFRSRADGARPDSLRANGARRCSRGVQ